MIEIPKPLSTGRRPVGLAVHAAARLADAADVPDHALAVRAVLQVDRQLLARRAFFLLPRANPRYSLPA